MKTIVGVITREEMTDRRQASLVHKTREFCRWALTQDFDYLFKCDDDTFVVTDRFLKFDPAGRDYHETTEVAGRQRDWVQRQPSETPL